MHRSPSGRTVALLLASLLLGACSDEPPEPASPSLSEGQPTNTAADFARAAAAEIADAVAGRRERNIEDDILRLEARLPGFGGLFVDSTGTLVLLAPAESSAASVKAIAAANAHLFRLQPEAQQQLMTGERVAVRPARYAFSQLLAWEQALHLGQGIVSLDAHEGINRVQIGVADSSGFATARTIAQATGIPADAIAVVLAAPGVLDAPRGDTQGSSRHRGKPSNHLQTLRNYSGQVIGGVIGGTQIATPSTVCTGGFTARFAWSVPLTFNGLLTASHCAPGALGQGTSPIDEFDIEWPNGVPIARVLGPPPLSNYYFNRPFNETGCNQPWCTRADAMFGVFKSGVTYINRLAGVDTVGLNSQRGGITINPNTVLTVGGRGNPSLGATLDKLDARRGGLGAR